MKLSLPLALALSATFALAQQPYTSSTVSAAWGTTADGLRLGAAFGSDPSKPTIRVVFQNLGPAVQEFVIAHNNGGGPIYCGMRFIATAPNSKRKEGLHSGIYIPIEGLVLPLLMCLNVGETHDLEFPLKDIIYASRKTVTLGALVKEGYSVTVRFESNQADANWAKLSRPWVGMLTSADISPAVMRKN